MFQDASFELSAGTPEQLPAGDLPEIVFSGRSNVGKSSLINRLVNRKALARVSATPGKTGTINFYRLDRCRLVDLPGYGYAKVSRSEKLRWAGLVEGYFAAGRGIALVIQIVDMRHRPTEDDLHMVDFLKSSGLRFVIAMTKSDKLNKTQRTAQEQLYRNLFAGSDPASLVPFSAVSGEGLEEIRALIEDSCGEKE